MSSMLGGSAGPPAARSPGPGTRPTLAKRPNWRARISDARGVAPSGGRGPRGPASAGGVAEGHAETGRERADLVLGERTEPFDRLDLRVLDLDHEELYLE